MAPVSGLLAHALTTHEPRPELALARITYEILGLIPAIPTTVEVRTIRPGPVSYTHLDVYKRQTQPCPSRRPGPSTPSGPS